jgi:hypothetical protein
MRNRSRNRAQYIFYINTTYNPLFRERFLDCGYAFDSKPLLPAERRSRKCDR